MTTAEHRDPVELRTSAGARGLWQRFAPRHPAVEQPAEQDGRSAQTKVWRLGEALSRMIGESRWRLELWDGRIYQPHSDPTFTVRVLSRGALDRLLAFPPDRGFGRAYAEGSLEIEPLEEFLSRAGNATPRQLLAATPLVLAAAVALGARPNLRPLREGEARLRGRRHSQERDSAAVRFHYDVSPDFYALWLDRTMTYSCAYFRDASDDIDTAQRAKLDLVCTKLRLQPGERFLDIGSGWGSLVIHAAQQYGVEGTGITLSPPQVETARRRAEEQGVGEQTRFSVTDYRSPGPQYDAIASVGMVEHVGRPLIEEYARSVARSLRPGGRALIHGITQPVTQLQRSPFIDAFVFPDGELVDVGFLVAQLERAGLEVRDVESLREHYALTLDRWSRRLDARYDEAVSIAGSERTRIWRVYMASAADGFRRGSFGIHQILVVKPTSQGASRLPLTRADWYRSTATVPDGQARRRRRAEGPAGDGKRPRAGRRRPAGVGSEA
ncbi:MAG TPA: cyclopropane-fatty-acyl-phospholipid synthase family protein [Candidatus Sulfotelmatobacter sp.]|nr:cyclopropane-fatty-acyl-phospholipid synthase family protein [Candidatus Sulfotelmatobacter sp.]